MLWNVVLPDTGKTAPPRMSWFLELANDSPEVCKSTNPESILSYYLLYQTLTGWAIIAVPQNHLRARYQAIMGYPSTPEPVEIIHTKFSSVAQSCPTLWDSTDYSTPGFPGHQLPELAQTHVHRVGDGIQPSHPLPPPSPPAISLSQHQGLFQWVSFSHQVAKVLEFSASASVLPMNTQDWFLLGLTGLMSFQSKGLSRVFSNTTVQKHQFFSAQLSLWSKSHNHARLDKP